jgi:hypothetical protein
MEVISSGRGYGLKIHNPLTVYKAARENGCKNGLASR